ncbi:MAG: hypothetical protein DWQ04_00965 [Chloroflexi bacterium]|nr:MAG: hypothetical protein DWQ04_00965 [Chloroflexota bacterium]
MHSSLVVISWWSNCLGLTCLHKLAKFTQDRPIFVVQVGKSNRQKKLFRQFLPQNVQELDVATDAPAEHSRVVSHVIRHQLSSANGLWFVDHDLLLHENWEPWLKGYDSHFQVLQNCLGLPPTDIHPAITQPTFWLSPRHFPPDISLDPIPFQTRQQSRRPDLYPFSGALTMPTKDTLVHARDLLQEQGRVSYYSFDHFPSYSHIGGLFLFAGPPIEHPDYQEWQQTTIAQFVSFFENCPAEWLAIEDSTLLHRIRTFQKIS